MTKFSVPIYFVTCIDVEAENEEQAVYLAETSGIRVYANVNGKELQIDYEDTGEPLNLEEIS